MASGIALRYVWQGDRLGDSVRLVVSVQRPRYIPEHMFALPDQLGHIEQGADGWI
jgi:hypothetical protein